VASAVVKNVNAATANLNKVETSPMTDIEKIAQKIAPKLQEDLNGKGFIVPTIVVISALVSIIVNLVKLSKMCKYDSEQALEHIKSPNVLDKIKIRKAIRASLKENKITLPRTKAADEGLALIEKAISSAASKLSKKDVNLIIDGVEE
jgi:hypothetical protein